MDLLYIGIGKRIKERRKKLKLTQTQIYNETHISSGHMSDIENEKKLPSTPTLISLSEILDCSVDWILTGNSPNSEIVLSDVELELINKTRLLTSDDIEEIMNMIDFKISKLSKQSKANITSAPLCEGDQNIVTI